MIAKNDPVDLPIFHGTRIMEITVLTCDDNWSWCPGTPNPADLLTRTGSTLEDIRSESCGSYSKVLKALTLLLKKWIIPRLSRETHPTWNTVRNSISISIVSCFKPAADLFIVRTNSSSRTFDRSFRSHVGGRSPDLWNNCTGSLY